MLSFYNADGLFYVDDYGNVARKSPLGNPDFMPSLTFSLGYRPPAHDRHAVWVRTRIFWQFPFNNLALPHLALQAGYSFSVKERS